MSIVLDGSGTISSLTAGGLPDGTVTAADLASTLDLSGKTVTLPAGVGGKVLQVVSATKTDTFSTTSTSLIDVSGLSVTLTPSTITSKFLITVNITYISTHYAGRVALIRNSTEIGMADEAGVRPRSFLSYSDNINANADGPWVRSSMSYMDSPSTSSPVTYKIQASNRVDGEAGAIYINRTFPDRNNIAYDPRGISTITVMEIAA